MFQKGEVVYHDNLVFVDGVKDCKKCRPCIVLSNMNIENTDCVLTCPVTSNVKKFNKYPGEFLLVPVPIYHYHTLSFAKINTFVIKPAIETHSTGVFVSSDYADLIIDKRMHSERPEYDIIKNYLRNEHKSTNFQKVIHLQKNK